jgi:acyl-CoA synthetase (NDP forming)
VATDDLPPTAKTGRLQNRDALNPNRLSLQMNISVSAKPQFADVSALLEPKSIAIIGASDSPGAVSGQSIRLLQKFRYPGAVYPINPKRPEVLGLPCFPSVSALPAPADLAIIATPAETVPNLVRECAAAGIRFGICWGGGFAEVGGQGKVYQDELVTACRETGFSVMGPNCLGVINTHMPAIPTFASFLLDTEKLYPGSVSMVSQSGGTATCGQALAQQLGFGFRYMISVGNEAVLDAADYLYAVAHDDKTKVICAYLEGVRDGGKFVAALRAARLAGKPVVILKGGMTAASARAAAAHTGALAGAARVWDAIFREEGVIEAGSLEQLIDIVLYLSTTDLSKLPKGNGVASVVFGGGGGVLSADQCVRHGLQTPPLTDQTTAKLKPLVPPIASIGNPIDLTPQAFNQEKWFATFGQSLDVIASDPGVDTVMLLFAPMGQRGLEIAREIVNFQKRCPKHVCIAWQFAPKGVHEQLRADGLYVFHEFDRAIATVGKIVRRQMNAQSGERAKVAPIAFDWAAHVPNPKPGTVISENECHAIMAAAGLGVAPGRLARSEDEAVEAANAVGMPVAMKGISPSVTHRAAAGLLALGLNSPEAVRATYRQLTDGAKASGIGLDGLYVQHMVEGGLEILISAFRDPLFGPMISVGAGGGLTELIDDIAIARAPIDEAGALALVEQLRLMRSTNKMKRPPDRALLARYIARVSQVAAGAPWRQYVLEINPVKWSAEDVTAVDGLLIVEEP